MEGFTFSNSYVKTIKREKKCSIIANIPYNSNVNKKGSH